MMETYLSYEFQIKSNLLKAEGSGGH